MRLNIGRIKSFMTTRDMSPKELAKRLNKSDSWTYLMLQGKAGKTFKIVEQIAIALKCKEPDIISWY